MITISFVHLAVQDSNDYGIRIFSSVVKEFSKISDVCIAPWFAKTFVHHQRDKYETINHVIDSELVGQTILTNHWDQNGTLENALIRSLLKFREQEDINVEIRGKQQDIRQFSTHLAGVLTTEKKYAKIFSDKSLCDDLPQFSKTINYQSEEFQQLAEAFSPRLKKRIRQLT